MYDFLRNGFQVQACRHVGLWCRQAREELVALRSTQVPGGGTDMQLENWQQSLRELESEAAHLLSTGHYNPVAVAHLTAKTQTMVGALGRSFGRPTDPNTPSPDRWKEAIVAMEERVPVPIGGHTLPPLPYPYDALEPNIDEKTMRLHHTRHHQSYVDGLNRAEKMMAQARKTGDYDLLRHWEREAAFHGSGHYLHTIFWFNMSPEGGGEPTGELAAYLARDFGSVAKFKEHFTKAAEEVEGVGWAILVWAPRAQRMEILTAEKHQHFTQWDTIPLLVLDVWEHAYYLKYQNEREKYIQAWWNVVDWSDVNRRFEQAKRLTWKPF